MPTITIDPEISSLCLTLSDEEARQLEEALLADGCREPLTLWGDVLLDGHNRLEICDRHGIDYETVQASGIETRADAVNWVIRNQLGRRNLSPTDASYLRGKRYNLEKMTPEERNRNANAARHSPAPQNEEWEKDRVEQRHGLAGKMAKNYGVSHNVITRDAKFASAVDAIAKTVSPEAAREIRSGKAGLTRTQVREIGAMPAEQQRTAYEKARAEPRKRRQKEPTVRTNVYDLPQRDPGDDNIPALLKEQAGKLSIACYQIDKMITTAPDVLARNVPSTLTRNIDDHIDAAIDWLIAFREERRRLREEVA